jgi:hypothetical protein
MDAYDDPLNVLVIVSPGAVMPAVATYVCCVENDAMPPELVLAATGITLPAPVAVTAYPAG